MQVSRIRSGLRRPALISLILMAGLWTSRPAQAASTPVQIQNFAFGPDTVTIPVGTTVVWTNQDSASHTTSSDAASAVSWNSGSLNQGQSFSFTFSTAGTFTYHCAIHPFMTGTVIVQGNGGPTPLPPTATPVPTIPGVPAVVPSPTATPTVTLSPTATATPTVVPTKTSTSSRRAGKTIAARSKGQSFIFNPTSTTIKVGTRVTWVNRSDAPHTVTSTTKGWRFNKSLASRQISFTFRKAGTYVYHCTIHPGMHGTIVVKKS